MDLARQRRLRERPFGSILLAVALHDAAQGRLLVFRVDEIGHDRLEDLLGLLRERASWLEAKGCKMREAARPCGGCTSPTASRKWRR